MKNSQIITGFVAGLAVGLVIFLGFTAVKWTSNSDHSHTSQTTQTYVFPPLDSLTAAQKRTHAVRKQRELLTGIEKENWADLEMEEKVKILETIASIEQKYLGISKMFTSNIQIISEKDVDESDLAEDSKTASSESERDEKSDSKESSKTSPSETEEEAEDPDQSKSASEDSDSGKSEKAEGIVLKEELLQSSSENSLQEMIHQIYHRYQICLFALYETTRSDSQNLAYLSMPQKYENDFKQDPDAENRAFISCKYPTCEEEARKYAEMTSKEYFELIEDKIRDESDNVKIYTFPAVNVSFYPHPFPQTSRHGIL